MIAVRLQGRLGNQLFQYAFAYATAKTLGTNFYIDKQIEPFILSSYFELKNDLTSPLNAFFKIKGYRNIFSHRLKTRFFKLIRAIFNLETIEFSNESKPHTNLLKIKNKAIYKGFFQSEDYFKNVADEINSLFKLKPKFKIQFKKVAEKFPADKTIVAIHIRKGDYVELGWDLPIDYYHQIINQLDMKNSYFIFLSDEPEAIKKEFDYLPHMYVSRHEEIIDFQLLMNANICILANSSFSWWGAYLNEKNPKVFAPKFWLGIDKEIPTAVLPKNWIKC